MIRAWWLLLLLCALPPRAPRHDWHGPSVITSLDGEHAAPAPIPTPMDVAPSLKVAPAAGVEARDPICPAPRLERIWLTQHRLLC